MVKRLVAVPVCLLWTVGLLVAAGFVSLTTAAVTGPAGARGTGHDAFWIGHAWVDGRKTQSDVDALAQRLRGTGITDLLVHDGPFNDDGTLTAPPRAAWAVAALHKALPGVRVQAWLGAHPADVELSSSAVRGRLLTSMAQALDRGFDGVHLDFEPVVDGDRALLTLLDQARALTRARHAILSISASHTSPAPVLPALGAAAGLAVWSNGYLHQVAIRVDQVALMVYDSGLPTATLVAGYVRTATEDALAAVPAAVALLIGLPAYREATLVHYPDAETVGVTLLGVRKAVAHGTRGHVFGVALYVDYTITEADWRAYRDSWVPSRPGG